MEGVNTLTGERGFSTLRRVYRWCNAEGGVPVMARALGFSTLRRVYRWCNWMFGVSRSRPITVSVPSDGSTGGVTHVLSILTTYSAGFSTLRRVYRWCNAGGRARLQGPSCVSVPSDGSTGGVTLRSASAWRICLVVSVPSDGSTGGVTQIRAMHISPRSRFQYPQTGLQVV